MNPGEQIRVAGSVRRTVDVDAVYPLVNSFHFGNQPLSIRFGGERRGGNKLAGAAQAAKDILAKGGMVPHAGQRQRMQHLQK